MDAIPDRERDHVRLLQQLKGASISFSLTILSIIQGVALAALAAVVAAGYRDFSLVTWVLALTTLAMIGVVYFHIGIDIIGWVWIPTMSDAAVPILLGAEELFLCYTITGPLGVWLLGFVAIHVSSVLGHAHVLRKARAVPPLSDGVPSSALWHMVHRGSARDERDPLQRLTRRAINRCRGRALARRGSPGRVIMTTDTTLFVSDAGPATGGHDMPSSDTSGHAPLTHIQALHFELIRTIQYNTLNGAQVVEDLLQWRALWDSVIADRQPTPRLGPTTDDQYNVYPPLALLRTTRYDDWPADTLYIWTDQDRLPRLRRLIEEHWQASEIELVDQDDVAFMFHGFYRLEHRVLEIWWD